MFLERLELVDYRSYPSLALSVGPGAQVLVGPNAQGKTNVLEAVHYLAIGSSHRVAADAPLVRQGAEAAIIRAVARLDAGAADPAPRRDDDPEGRLDARTVDPGPRLGHELRVELELRPGGRNRARLNGQQQPRSRDVIGAIRSVLFAPEDLALVRGDPAERRRFLDDLLGQRRAAYKAARAEYDRVLRQRNALLRELRVTGAPADSLDVWTDALANAGAALLAARIAAVHALAGPCEAAYRDLVTASPRREASGAVGLAYELSTGRTITAEPGSGVPDPAELAAELRAGLAERARAEHERGVTLVGPHRDELVLHLNDLPAKGYASHGELWSLALALRLASRDVLADVGEEPIVLLDDVFAELDDQRRDRLARRCAAFEQVLVTAAVDEDVPLAGPRYRVRESTITPPPPAPASAADDAAALPEVPAPAAASTLADAAPTPAPGADNPAPAPARRESA